VECYQKLAKDVTLDPEEDPCVGEEEYKTAKIYAF
jgi:hypothetical protein